MVTGFNPFFFFPLSENDVITFLLSYIEIRRPKVDTKKPGVFNMCSNKISGIDNITFFPRYSL